jgi:hypothetical protein
VKHAGKWVKELIGDGLDGTGWKGNPLLGYIYMYIYICIYIYVPALAQCVLVAQ